MQSRGDACMRRDPSGMCLGELERDEQGGQGGQQGGKYVHEQQDPYSDDFEMFALDLQEMDVEMEVVELRGEGWLDPNEFDFEMFELRTSKTDASAGAGAGAEAEAGATEGTREHERGRGSGAVGGVGGGLDVEAQSAPAVQTQTQARVQAQALSRQTQELIRKHFELPALEKAPVPGGWEVEHFLAVGMVAAVVVVGVLYLRWWWGVSDGERGGRRRRPRQKRGRDAGAGAGGAGVGADAGAFRNNSGLLSVQGVLCMLRRAKAVSRFHSPWLGSLDGDGDGDRNGIGEADEYGNRGGDDDGIGSGGGVSVDQLELLSQSLCPLVCGDLGILEALAGDAASSLAHRCRLRRGGGGSGSVEGEENAGAEWVSVGVDPLLAVLQWVQAVCESLALQARGGAGMGGMAAITGITGGTIVTSRSGGVGGTSSGGSGSGSSWVRSRGGMGGGVGVGGGSVRTLHIEDRLSLLDARRSLLEVRGGLLFCRDVLTKKLRLWGRRHLREVWGRGEKALGAGKCEDLSECVAMLQALLEASSAEEDAHSTAHTGMGAGIGTGVGSAEGGLSPADAHQCRQMLGRFQQQLSSLREGEDEALRGAAEVRLGRDMRMMRDSFQLVLSPLQSRSSSLRLEGDGVGSMFRDSFRFSNGSNASDNGNGSGSTDNGGSHSADVGDIQGSGVRAEAQGQAQGHGLSGLASPIIPSSDRAETTETAETAETADAGHNSPLHLSLSMPSATASAPDSVSAPSVPASFSRPPSISISAPPTQCVTSTLTPIQNLTAATSPSELVDGQIRSQWTLEGWKMAQACRERQAEAQNERNNSRAAEAQRARVRAERRREQGLQFAQQLETLMEQRKTSHGTELLELQQAEAQLQTEYQHALETLGTVDKGVFLGTFLLAATVFALVRSGFDPTKQGVGPFYQWLLHALGSCCRLLACEDSHSAHTQAHSLAGQRLWWGQSTVMDTAGTSSSGISDSSSMSTALVVGGQLAAGYQQGYRTATGVMAATAARYLLGSWGGSGSGGGGGGGVRDRERDGGGSSGSGSGDTSSSGGGGGSGGGMSGYSISSISSVGGWLLYRTISSAALALHSTIGDSTGSGAGPGAGAGAEPGSAPALWEMWAAVRCLGHLLLRALPAVLVSRLLGAVGLPGAAEKAAWLLTLLGSADVLLHMALGPLRLLLLLGLLHLFVYVRCCLHPRLRWLLPHTRSRSLSDVRPLLLYAAYPLLLIYAAAYCAYIL